MSNSTSCSIHNFFLWFRLALPWSTDILGRCLMVLASLVSWDLYCNWDFIFFFDRVSLCNSCGCPGTHIESSASAEASSAQLMTMTSQGHFDGFKALCIILYLSFSPWHLQSCFPAFKFSTMWMNFMALSSYAAIQNIFKNGGAWSISSQVYHSGPTSWYQYLPQFYILLL